LEQELKNHLRSILRKVKGKQMSNRHSDALFITQGACNPIAIVKRIHAALEEVMASPDYKGTMSQKEDPAVRLMVHQLAFLVGVGEGAMPEAYTEAYAKCRELAEVETHNCPLCGERLPQSREHSCTRVGKTDVVKAAAAHLGLPVIDLPVWEDWSKKVAVSPEGAGSIISGFVALAEQLPTYEELPIVTGRKPAFDNG